jgi:2-hydroxychromene-2-carboxylate isomerase
MEKASHTNEQIHLEFWFEFASNYSYLSVMRIEALTKKHDIKVHWKPFLLGPIFKTLGWNTSPFVLQKEKGRYVWQDMQRQAKKYQLPWNLPSNFPRSGLLPMRVAAACANEIWISEYCQKIMQINFVHDQEIDTPAVVHSVLTSMHLDADSIIQTAISAQNASLLRAQTEVAMARGLFGAPTFMVGEEMFWGDDRLEDAIEFILEKKRNQSNA